MPALSSPLPSSLHEQRDWLRSRNDAILRLQVRLAQVPAPTGQEVERGHVVARYMRHVGIPNIRTDSAGNVIGTMPAPRDESRSAPIVVLAHLDTVFPAGQSCTVRTEGTRHIGPGIGDNSRGLAGMLALAASISRSRTSLRRPIVFAATTGEEGSGNLRGARHLFASLDKRPACALALDGPGSDTIVHQALGSRRFRVSFSGPGGHSWASAGAANAVHAAGRATEILSRWRAPESRASLAVTRIGGGLSINAIPADAWLEVDVRGLSMRALDAGESAVRAAVERAVRQENETRRSWSDPCRASVELIGDRPAGKVDESSPLVRHAIAATLEANREPVLCAASTDANVPISLGIPAIAIGAGGTGGGAHTTEEWYDNSEGWVGLERALRILLLAAAD